MYSERFMVISPIFVHVLRPVSCCKQNLSQCFLILFIVLFIHILSPSTVSCRIYLSHPLSYRLNRIVSYRIVCIYLSIDLLIVAYIDENSYCSLSGLFFLSPLSKKIDHMVNPTAISNIFCDDRYHQ